MCQTPNIHTYDCKEDMDQKKGRKTVYIQISIEKSHGI